MLYQSLSMLTPFMMSEGGHVDHFGNLIWTVYVDLRDPSERKPVSTLIKGCRPEHAIETSEQILISKPGRFRQYGENLIRDPAEAYASLTKTTYERIDDPDDHARARRSDQRLNRAGELVGAKVTHSTTSTRSTGRNTQSVTFGKNGWIFCASIEPSNHEEMDRWKATLESGYNHISYIYRPREFARALASMVAEQLGTQGKPTSMTHSFQGERKLRTHHEVQFLWHGPVIYVDDVYDLMREAETEQHAMFLSLFAKESQFRDQREYRFAIWSETEPVEETAILDATPAMIGAMSKQAQSLGPQIMPSVEPIEEVPAQANDDLTFDDEYDEEVDDADCCPTSEYEPDDGSPWSVGSLLKDPLIPVRPREIDLNNLPDDLQAKTTTYAAVEALRNKIDGPYGISELHPERKPEATSAAWYAEQDIRKLCQIFHNPISRISISPDNFIVISVSLPDWPDDIKCTLAVSPSGESVLHLVSPPLSPGNNDGSAPILGML